VSRHEPTYKVAIAELSECGMAVRKAILPKAYRVVSAWWAGTLPREKGLRLSCFQHSPRRVGSPIGTRLGSRMNEKEEPNSKPLRSPPHVSLSNNVTEDKSQ